MKSPKSETWTAIGAIVALLLFLAAVAWWNVAWEKWRASIYADEFQRRGLAPQAVPK